MPRINALVYFARASLPRSLREWSTFKLFSNRVGLRLLVLLANIKLIWKSLQGTNQGTLAEGENSV